jgi:hypothetical protein
MWMLFPLADIVERPPSRYTALCDSVPMGIVARRPGANSARLLLLGSPMSDSPLPCFGTKWVKPKLAPIEAACAICTVARNSAQGQCGEERSLHGDPSGFE